MKAFWAIPMVAIVGCSAPCPDCQIIQSKMDELGPPETIHRVELKLIIEDIVPKTSGEPDWGLSA